MATARALKRGGTPGFAGCMRIRPVSVKSYSKLGLRVDKRLVYGYTVYMPLSKEKMREYQRERRKAAKLILGEKEPVVQTPLGGNDVVTSKGDSALPWPLNPNKSPRWGVGVEHYIPPTEEEKEAIAGLHERKTEAMRRARQK